MASSRTQFVSTCARRFQDHYGKAAGEAEQASWSRSWPVLVDALMQAGLGELWLGLEYELHGSGERVDALLLGSSPEADLTAVVIEFKQWSTECTPLAHDSVRVVVCGEVRPHPCFQAAGYVRYLETWLDRSALPLTVGGVAVLHNAPQSLVDSLRTAVATTAGSSRIPILGKDDLTTDDAPTLAARFGCPELSAPTSDQVETFLAARHAPPLALFEQLGAVLDGDPAFVLIGEQQRAQLELLRRFDEAWRTGKRHFLVVTGGPGTGKTVIATRLLASVPQRAQELGVRCGARYPTPSGALRWQLERAADGSAAKGLFTNVGVYVNKARHEPEVIVVDEAQRNENADATVSRLLRLSKVGVFFLDERQIIRPNEGITADRLTQLIRESGAEVTSIDLTSQFRCGGSQRYQDWLDTLLCPIAQPRPWDRGDYDLAVVASPVQLQDWVDKHTADGKVARITAGFCWPWDRKRSVRLPLLAEVAITWTDPTTGEQRTWSRPWNSAHTRVDAHGTPQAPESRAWATDPGGHNQIGCIYTSQGLEYPYNGVIIGPDLVWRGNRWRARPERSEDNVLKSLAPEGYLPLALNIYRVLLSRGSRGCRVYSTDPETQAFLHGLLPTAAQ